MGGVGAGLQARASVKNRTMKEDYPERAILGLVMPWPQNLPRWLPQVLLVLLVPCLLFPGALPGALVVSADDHLSVHHAFQTTAAGEVAHPQLSDPAVQFKALRERVLADLSQAKAPLWNPDIYAGAPLLADGQSRVFSPVTWAHLVLPEATAQDLGVYWMLTWTGLGTLLLLYLFGLGRWAALVGALGAMTGPYLHVWLLHPHASTFAWIPWVLAGVESLRRTGRPVLLALAVAGLLGGGHLETATHGLLFGLAWAAWRARRSGVLWGLGLGALLSAPAWLPLVEQIERSATLAAHGGNRLFVGQLLDLVWPGWHGHPADAGYTGSGVWGDGVLHPGLVCLGLALLAWNTRGRPILVAWGVCVVLSVVGLPGPMNHARLGAMGALAAALAAAFGVGRLPPRWGPAVALGVLATGGWARHLDQGMLEPSRHSPEPAAWTQRLAETVGDGRVVGLGWALQPNTGALAGLADVRGYDLPVSKDTERFMSRLDSALVRPWFRVAELSSVNELLLEIAGVRAVLSTQPLEGRVPIDVGDAPLWVYALNGESPRAWLAGSARLAHTPESALAELLEASDPRGSPPVEGLERAWTGPGDWTALTVTALPGGEVSVEVSVDREALLVLADAWAPGWLAEVDGQEREVLRVGGLFRGVVLVPGEREVVFRYRPWGWVWGLRLGLLGLLGLLGVVLQIRRSASK